MLRDGSRGADEHIPMSSYSRDVPLGIAILTRTTSGIPNYAALAAAAYARELLQVLKPERVNAPPTWTVVFEKSK